MKKNIFLSLIIVVASLVSCTNNITEEPPLDNLLNYEYINLDFNIRTPQDNFQTRCIENLNNENRDFFAESCLTDKYNPMAYKLIILVDDKIVSSDSLIRSLKDNRKNIEIPDFNDHNYITYVKQNNDLSLSFGLRFLRSLDPSKIMLICVGSKSNDDQIKNCEIGKSINDIVIQSQTLSRYCNFVSKHQLATTNDWGKVNTKITLKRNSAQIIVLHPDSKLGMSGKYEQISDSYTYTEIQCVPNFTNSINHFENFQWAFVAYSASGDYAKSYYFFNNRNTIISKDNLRFNGTNRSNNPQTYGNYGTTVNYSGKNYGFFTPLDICTSENGHLPVTENNEEYKYITLAVHYYTGRAGDQHYCLWSNIEMPSDQLESNKRYVMILKDSTPLWQNTTQSNFTRGENIEMAKEIITSDFYDVIEFDMDEPLPFEIINDESIE